MKQDEQILIRFGERLSALRDQKGWSQTVLAVKIETSTSYISRLENGHTEPGLFVLSALIKALGCSADDLLMK